MASHTDAAGADAYNAGLSARRARAVRDALVASGTDRSRVVMIIYGEAAQRPSAPYAGANRVVVLYATRLAPGALAQAAVGSSTAVLWTNPRAPRVAIGVRLTGRASSLMELKALRDEALRL